MRIREKERTKSNFAKIKIVILMRRIVDDVSYIYNLKSHVHVTR